jgi:hypothetical protein
MMMRIIVICPFDRMRQEWLRESGFHRDNIVFVNPKRFMKFDRFREVCVGVYLRG